MNEINPIVADAIREASEAAHQPKNVATRILAWLQAAASEGITDEEKAQRLGLIRDEIEIAPDKE